MAKWGQKSKFSLYSIKWEIQVSMVINQFTNQKTNFSSVTLLLTYLRWIKVKILKDGKMRAIKQIFTILTVLNGEIIIVAPSGDKILNFEMDIVKGPLNYLIWKFGRANTLIGWVMMVSLAFPSLLMLIVWVTWSHICFQPTCIP